MKDGHSLGKRRYLCKSCGRSFGEALPRYSKELKAKALEMYLNNVGIRKIGLFLGVSPSGVLKWIRKAHREMAARARAAAIQLESKEADVIELDEIYTTRTPSITKAETHLIESSNSSIRDNLARFKRLANFGISGDEIKLDEVLKTACVFALELAN